MLFRSSTPFHKNHIPTRVRVNAATCGFLCSDEAAFITGQVIGVNGGMVL